MTLGSTHKQPRSSPTLHNPEIVDRHDQRIGIKTTTEPGFAGGTLQIQLTGPLSTLLGVEDGPVEVPSDWVEGIRPDEIRLSMSLRDPLLRAGLRSEG